MLLTYMSFVNKHHSVTTSTAQKLLHFSQCSKKTDQAPNNGFTAVHIAIIFGIAQTDPCYFNASLTNAAYAIPCVSSNTDAFEGARSVSTDSVGITHGRRTGERRLSGVGRERPQG